MEVAVEKRSADAANRALAMTVSTELQQRRRFVDARVRLLARHLSGEENTYYVGGFRIT